MRRLIASAPLGIFLLVLTGFNILLFSTSFSLGKKEAALFAGKIPGGGQWLSVLEKEGITGKEYRGNFAFVAALRHSFEMANKNILAEYAFSEKERAAIRQLTASGKLTAAEVRAIVSDTTRQKLFNDYGSWLYSRAYNDPTQADADLAGVYTGIGDQVTSRYGFSPDFIKESLFSLTRSSVSPWYPEHGLFLFSLLFGLALLAALACIFAVYAPGPPGIKNNGIFQNPSTNAGWIGMITGTWLILFYIVLYWYPEYLTNWVLLADPLSYALSGNPASRWFLYGFLYCVAMLIMGVRMILKYRHSKYQVIRTISVLFFQLGFAFLIPEILVRFNQPYYDFKNIWPLDYDFFFDWHLDTLLANGSLGLFMLVWGLILIVIGVPVMVYFFGKRWYCSWVCGCGGLAETLGDPFRQLSDKRLKAWQIERWLIHSVLVFAVIMTGFTLYTYFTGAYELAGIKTPVIQKTYGFLIGSVFAGVVGTGFYPLMGNRVWCRFGCPLAAYLGLVQRFRSRFRITTNGGQCISCGNCSTYCEMGIDVRAYAQKGQNIVRSSCVGCGICAAVCPRGVLKLENGPLQDRIHENPILVGNRTARLNDKV
jgi:ferredoxin-type protein NapH